MYLQYNYYTTIFIHKQEDSVADTNVFSLRIILSDSECFGTLQLSCHRMKSPNHRKY